MNEADVLHFTLAAFVNGAFACWYIIRENKRRSDERWQMTQERFEAIRASLTTMFP